MKYLQVNEEKKQCCFWVYGKERYKECKNEEIQNMMDVYHKKGYQVTVFVGGEKPLLPVMTQLFQVQEKMEMIHDVEVS